jgi:hypothetical protein
LRNFSESGEHPNGCAQEISYFPAAALYGQPPTAARWCTAPREQPYSAITIMKGALCLLGLAGVAVNAQQNDEQDLPPGWVGCYQDCGTQADNQNMDRVCDDIVRDVTTIDECIEACGDYQYFGLACPRADAIECWCCNELDTTNQGGSGRIPASECDGGDYTSGVNNNRQDHCNGFDGSHSLEHADGSLFSLGGHCRAAIYNTQLGGGANEARVCEGSNMAIDCADQGGGQINIRDASYGRQDGPDVCPHAATSDQTCHAVASTTVVAGFCQGQESCSISATNSIFGDPCGGTYKYLTVSYDCVSTAPQAAAANCIAETCHNDGHWQEVAFPEVDSMEGCIEQCLLHPEATALQFNDDGWCGCMTMGDDVSFDEAIASGQHIGPWTECTVCDLSALCHYEICHNDGHWQEVAFPDTDGQTGAAGLASCRDQCVSHPEATAFQFNDDGWCGCMTMGDGVTFAEAIAGGEHLGPWTECTICDISNAAGLSSGGGGSAEPLGTDIWCNVDGGALEDHWDDGLYQDVAECSALCDTFEDCNFFLHGLDDRTGLNRCRAQRDCQSPRAYGFGGGVNLYERGAGTPGGGPDVTGDGVVNIDDLLMCLSAFDTSDAGDTNGDGVTNVTDLLAILSAFGG